MAEKTRSYKSDQLPGGKLWTPSAVMKKALADIDPTNDLCESIIGLNDWLQKGTPNFSQRTVSTMVEVLRNSTMPWFLRQDKEMRDKITNLAKKRSKLVRQEDRVPVERRLKRKRAREVEMGKVRQLKRMKKQKEIEETEILTKVEAVEEELAKASDCTANQQEVSRVGILKKQLQVRQPGKRLSVRVKGKKKTSDELLRELIPLIEEAEMAQAKEVETLLAKGWVQTVSDSLRWDQIAIFQQFITLYLDSKPRSQ